MRLGQQFQLDSRRAPGLVGLWGPGPSGGVQYFDMSGRGNDGVLTNGPTWKVDAERGWALNLVRASQQDVRVPNSPVLFGMSGLTLSIWAKSNGVHDSSNEYNLIDAWAGGDTNYLLRGDLSNQLEFYTDTSSGIVGRTFDDVTIDDSVWHHIVAVYDGAFMRGYVDGEASIWTAAQTGAIDAGATQLSIGGGISATDYWDGDLADARIYNRGLSASEVQHIYQKTRVEPYSDIQLRPTRVYKAAVAPGGGQPTMRRWGGVPHMTPGPVLAGRSW